MSGTRRSAVLAGALLIVALLAVLAAGALEPDPARPGVLQAASDAAARTRFAALLHLVAAAGSVGIAIALFPVLRQRHAGLALAAVVARSIEAAMYTAAVVPLLGLVHLGDRLAGATAAERQTVLALGGATLEARDDTIAMGVLAFSVGALAYYVAFFRSRLVPRWLSGWGVIAALLMGTATVLALATGNDVRGYALLILPILLQEQVLGVWLLARGFAEPDRVVVGRRT